MADLIANSFTTYQLTDEEMIVGSILTIAQKQVLQNMLSVSAEEKIVLEYDVKCPETFIQQEAYKRGQIELLQYILDQSDAAVASREPQQPQE